MSYKIVDLFLAVVLGTSAAGSFNCTYSKSGIQQTSRIDAITVLSNAGMENDDAVDAAPLSTAWMLASVLRIFSWFESVQKQIKLAMVRSTD